MHTSDKFLTLYFDLQNPPLLDRAGRANTLSLKAVRTAIQDNASLFDEERGHVAQGLLYLWHDHWNDAHEIAQANEGEPLHDYLHAIVHRREGDFSNSNYWFRSAGLHPASILLAKRGEHILNGPDLGIDATVVTKLKGEILPNGMWDSSKFIKAVRDQGRTHNQGLGQIELLLRRLQAEEIRLFFEAMIA